MKKPSPLPKFMVLVQPFRGDVWAGVISTITICFAMTVCIGLLHPCFCYSYRDLIFYLVGAFLNQAQEATFRFQSNSLRFEIFKMIGNQELGINLSFFFRILCGFCILGSFIWNSYYNDEMIASLSIPIRPSKIGEVYKIHLVYP